MKLGPPLATLADLRLALPGSAQERPAGLVAVGDRVFLAPGQPDRQPTGDPPAEVAHWMHVDVAFSEMGWFRELLDTDPLLGPLRVRMEVTRLPEPPAAWFADAQVLARFGDRERVPEELRLDGYDVQSVLGQVPSREINLRPARPAPEFMLRCHPPRLWGGAGAFRYCKLMASYRPDPSIMLAAELFDPPPLQDLAPDLPAVVARLREMALCLDVTEAPPTDPEDALKALLAANPRLEGCEAEPSS